MAHEIWKVGELASITGVTVRTLHHYDEIGLLCPSMRTGSGHRLYTNDDISRLLRIRSLRQLGFSLDEIRACLNDPDFAPGRIIELHLKRLGDQITLQQKLARRLKSIAKRLDEKKEIDTETFLQTIREMVMTEKFDKYYTPEQLKYLEQRREAVGEQRIDQAESEWKILIDQLRAAMDDGVDPASPKVLRLAKQYKGLIDEFTGGNPEIAESLRNMYRKEPGIASEHGFTWDPKMMEFMGKALAAKEDQG